MTAEGTAASPRPSERVGKYEIVEKIGEGAMGEVFKARDTVLDRFVAIKTVSSGVVDNPEIGQRFLREAQSAARLNHPNVVTLHEFGEDGGRYFMAMELLGGEDLSRTLKRGGLPRLEDKIAVMEEILDGVAYAHQSGVVHRDLKPANIQIQANGHIKVMDFGLARIGPSAMTRTGTVMGTPHYMSPEQVRGESTSAASDVFALGAVFYEMLGGRRAFDADSMHAVLFKVMAGDPTPLGECDPDIPQVLVTFVARALVKDENLRYRDGTQMRRALELCRRVLDGSLDVESADDAMRGSSTILQSPGEVAAVSLVTEPKTKPPHESRIQGPGTTLPLRKGTRIGVRKDVTPEPAGARQSRTPMLITAIAIVGLLGAIAIFNWPPTPPPPPVDHQARAAFGAAVEAQLDSARRSLEFKDPEAAATAAEKALRFEPGNAEARDIAKRARASLDVVEAAASEARRAADAGNLDAASKALVRVLDLMPKHPVAAELSTQLASRFKARADIAMKDMRGAADAARRAGGSSLRAYAEATSHASLAEAAYGRKQYTEASQKYAEAQRSYDRAGRDARDLASRKTAATVATPLAPPQATPAPFIPLAPATPHPTVAQAVAPPPVIATPPPTAPAPRAVRDDDAAVRQVVANLKRAIEGKDLELYKRVRPGLTADEERRLRDAFQNVSSQQVDYAVDSVALDGDKATVRVTRSGRVSGQAVPSVRQVLRLSRTDSGWVIVEIGQ